MGGGQRSCSHLGTEETGQGETLLSTRLQILLTMLLFLLKVKAKGKPDGILVAV